MKIGSVSFINAFPFTLPLKERYPIQLGLPRGLNSGLKEGLLDIALTSSYLACSSEFDYLEAYGIAFHQSVLSVNLYSPYAPKDLNGKTIALDPSSLASVELLKILCRHHWKVEPHFVDFNTPHEAFLLIGDAALGKPHMASHVTIDLCEAWYHMTALPFVFALFIAQKGLNTTAFETCLDECLYWSESHLQTVIEAATVKTGLHPKWIELYFSKCRFRLTEKEWEGFLLYKELSQMPALSS
jgi:chorismate dehydratase